MTRKNTRRQNNDKVSQKCDSKIDEDIKFLSCQRNTVFAFM